MMKKVLVTGANGFVGRQLCEHLVSLGYEVHALVRTRDCDVNNVKVHICKDISSDVDGITSAMSGIDIVIHLAARVHQMKESNDDPMPEYYRINVTGTINLAQCAIRSNVKRFIYISSIKANGDASGTYTEENQIEPTDPYGLSKRIAENELKKLSNEIETIILRPPLIYGPGVKANFLSLLKVIQKGIPLPLDGITNKRSFLYIGNFIDAITSVLLHPNAIGQTFVVSDNDDASTTRLVKTMADAANIKPRLFYVPLKLMLFLGVVTRKSHVIDRLTGSLTVDSKRIQREIGWKPPYSLIEGIKQTVNWYLHHKDV